MTHLPPSQDILKPMSRLAQAFFYETGGAPTDYILKKGKNKAKSTTGTRDQETKKKEN